MFNEEIIADVIASFNSALIEVLRYVSLKRGARIEAAEQLVGAISAFYDEIGRFLWSFPLLANSQEKLTIIDQHLTKTRLLVAKLSIHLPKNTHECLKRFLEDCYGDMRIWKRRVSGTASLDEWQIEPEKDHLNGNLAKSYNGALKSLRAIARF